jgi:hypothetical protein
MMALEELCPGPFLDTTTVTSATPLGGGRCVRPCVVPFLRPPSSSSLRLLSELQAGPVLTRILALRPSPGAALPGVGATLAVEVSQNGLPVSALAGLDSEAPDHEPGVELASDRP